MATPSKPSTVDVNGLTVDEIMSMDTNSMGKKDLQKVATRLMSAANKRLKRLSQSEAGRNSPAFKAAEARGGKFSVKGKNLQQLKQEFANMRNFMGRKTSSLSGWSKVRREKKAELEGRAGHAVSKSVEKKFWDVYGKVAETDQGKAATAMKSSEQLQKAVLEQVEQGKSEEDILNDLDQTFTEMYEEMQDDFESGDIFDPDWEDE